LQQVCGWIARFNSVILKNRTILTINLDSLDLSYAMVGRQWINNPVDIGMELLGISNIQYPHPEYDSERRYMDQLLLKLDGIAARHTPIKLPLGTSSQENVEQQLGTIGSIQKSELFLLGAGQTDPSEFSPPDVLQRLNVDYTPNSQCSIAESRAKDVSYNGKILDDMICVQSGQCFGDSGSPLILRDLSSNNLLQIGIISWGGGRDCGDPDLPGVSSRVSAGAEFLQSTICAVSRIPPAYLQCGDDTLNGSNGGNDIESDTTKSNIMDSSGPPLEPSDIGVPTTIEDGENPDVSLESSQGTTMSTSQSHTDSIELEGDDISTSSYSSVEQPDDGLSSTLDCLLGKSLRFRKCGSRR
jgi:hypothetical protein